MPIIRLKEIAGMSIDDRAAKLYDLRAELARIETMIDAGGRVRQRKPRTRTPQNNRPNPNHHERSKTWSIRKAPQQPAKKEKPAKKTLQTKPEEQTSQ